VAWRARDAARDAEEAINGVIGVFTSKPGPRVAAHPSHHQPEVSA